MSPNTPLHVAPADTELFGVSVSASSPTATSVSVTYQGLPANLPGTYQNFVAIWSATMIPWNGKPLKQVTITSNNQSDSLIITGLDISANTYIVGYGVGAETSMICASAAILAVAARAAPTSVSLSLYSIDTGSLTVKYQTLAGYLPAQYGNWIGLWRGFASPYNAGPPLATAKVASMSSEDLVTFSNLALAAGFNYTLIYFVGADLTTAAAILNFST